MTASALLVDLYELTMAQSYLDESMEGLATFSLFVRNLPPDRGFLVAAGLEDALAYLEDFHFTADDLAYLEQLRMFTPRLLDRLAGLRFTGSVRALPEGTVCFADEPLLEVTASVMEAQLVETMLINELQLQTMIASKAARCVLAADGRPLVEFGLRRTQGADAGLKVARASYIAGFESTSNVLAGQRYGMPVAGTMAHSYIEAFEHEIDAFRAYARAYPDRAVLLVDTYDTIEGARRAAQVGQELAADGHRLRGVRLDSGDLNALSREVRAILDEAGHAETIIFASGALDEYRVEALVQQKAPIDGFGVGTRLGVSADAPYLDIAYKLVSYDGRPTLKLSTDKVTWPGAKQLWRTTTARGIEDWIGLAEESGPGQATALLEPVMEHGSRLSPSPQPSPARGEGDSADQLEIARERCRIGLAALPQATGRLRGPVPVQPCPTDGLIALRQQLEGRLRATVEVRR